eukprot:gnl/TRDRNA2_/TRDRNA2_148283_c0_seq1.p1 gnl/TRDRNA2_/TRDRNA2_148283_c0~~gnl/TRDRNA2_/TRDRNA2_148283_c0_seq1.p1  ORF type:complete len:120 (-),score=1.99 gnl/TRDRNA2_/TRDRNA2_148283_c0_seq1:147-506(-)
MGAQRTTYILAHMLKYQRSRTTTMATEPEPQIPAGSARCRTAVLVSQQKSGATARPVTSPGPKSPQVQHAPMHPQLLQVMESNWLAKRFHARRSSFPLQESASSKVPNGAAAHPTGLPW